MRILIAIFLILGLIASPLLAHAEFNNPAFLAKKPVFEPTTQAAKKITSKITMKECEVVLPKYTLKKTNVPYMPYLLKSEPSDKKLIVKTAYCKTPGYIDQTSMSVGQNLKSIGKYNPRVMLDKIP